MKQQIKDWELHINYIVFSGLQRHYFQEKILKRGKMRAQLIARRWGCLKGDVIYSL